MTGVKRRVDSHFTETTNEDELASGDILPSMLAGTSSRALSVDLAISTRRAVFLGSGSPMRAKRVRQTDSTSSFCSVDGVFRTIVAGMPAVYHGHL